VVYFTAILSVFSIVGVLTIPDIANEGETNTLCTQYALYFLFLYLHSALSATKVPILSAASSLIASGLSWWIR
jgi:hypothetical protein